MKYIRENIKPDDKTDKFLDEMMGHLTLTFTKDHVKADLPEWDAHIQGKTFHMAGSHEDAPYAVVSVGAHVVSVSSTDQATGKSTMTTYNFDSDDTLWIAADGAATALPIPKYREYFVRVHQGR